MSGVESRFGELRFVSGGTPLHFLFALADLETGGADCSISYGIKNTSPPPFHLKGVGKSGQRAVEVKVTLRPTETTQGSLENLAGVEQT